MKAKRIISVLLAIFMVIGMTAVYVPVSAENVAEGTCGENLTWTLDDKGLLTISGAGAMDDYEIGGEQPWLTLSYSITELTVDEGVTHIGRFAFYSCSNLRKINIPDNLNSIGEGAFAVCGIESLHIPENLTDLEFGAFIDCPNLKEISVDSGNPNYTSQNNILYSKDMTTLMVCAAKNENVKIPSSVKTIDGGAFGYCTNLTSITIPNGVTDIGNSAFGQCYALKEAKFPKSVKVIGSGVFWDCNALTDIYYTGSGEEWYSIDISDSGNEILGNVTMHFNAPEDSDPEQIFEFSDVHEKDWFYSDVQAVCNLGLMKGTSDTEFAPKANTNRAMFVTMLYRLEGEPEVSGKLKFTDCGSVDWAEKAIIWASDNKIVNGTTATTFAPKSAVTREQMALMLYNYAKFKGYDTSNKTDITKATDYAKVSDWAREAFAWANANELITGTSSSGLTLSPKNNAQRCQVAAIFNRFYEKFR